MIYTLLIIICIMIFSFIIVKLNTSGFLWEELFNRNKFSFEKVCTNCKHICKCSVHFEYIFAHSLSEYISCPKCQSINSICYHDLVNHELLNLWGNNPDYCFKYIKPECHVFESFVFNENVEYYLSMYLEAIDEQKYPIEKTNILLEAICHDFFSLYQLGPYDENDNSEYAIHCRKYLEIILVELIHRKDKVLEIEPILKHDYYKDFIFEKIGL